MTDEQIADACRLLAESRPAAAAMVLFLADDSVLVRVVGGDDGELRLKAGAVLLHGPEGE